MGYTSRCIFILIDMKDFTKTAYLLFVFTLGGFFLASPTQAEGVRSLYQVTYLVQPNGVVQVTEEIKLTRPSDMYVSEYRLLLHSPAVTNVAAFVDNEKITPQFEVQNNEAEITLPLITPTSDSEREQNIKLTYDVTDLIHQYGLLWEVVLPKVAPTPDLGSYEVYVVVPQSMGSLNLVQPQPRRREVGAEATTLFFDTEQMKTSGVLLELGSEQYFDLKLHYSLENTSNLGRRVEVALPLDIPDIQEVRVKSLNPKPQKVLVDNDGNYLATYELRGKEMKEVTFNGVVRVRADREERGGSNPINEIPTEIRQTYTLAQPYWEAGDSEIINLAQTQIQGLSSAYDQYQVFYQYVIDSLTYDQSRASGDIERLGAKKILLSPSTALCGDYTDLFIALARASGLPAREVDGYAFTSDTEVMPVGENVLHAWVEIFLPERGWVAIDPTWGDTTGGVDYFSRMDANHVALVRRGVSSLAPQTANAIDVDFSSEDNRSRFLSLDPISSLISLERPIQVVKIAAPKNLILVSGLLILGAVILLYVIFRIAKGRLPSPRR